MAIAVLIVVLVVGGVVGALLVRRSRASHDDSPEFINVSSRLDSAGTPAAKAETPESASPEAELIADATTDTEPAAEPETDDADEPAAADEEPEFVELGAQVVDTEPEPEPEADADTEADAVPVEAGQPEPSAVSEVDDADADVDELDDVVVAARFNAPGQRATGLTGVYEPTVPRKPVHLSVDADGESDASAELPDEATDGSADVAADGGEPETIINLSESTPAADGNVDHVLQALIGRVGVTNQEVAELAAELVERADLDVNEVAEVLADLVDRADEQLADPADRAPELVLFSEDVPRRPGQLTDFADLSDSARRRVIIRVLCLLVARADDQDVTPREPASEAETRQWPLSRAVWPLPPPDDDDDDLPARSHLARSQP